MISVTENLLYSIIIYFSHQILCKSDYFHKALDYTMLLHRMVTGYSKYKEHFTRFCCYCLSPMLNSKPSFKDNSAIETLNDFIVQQSIHFTQVNFIESSITKIHTSNNFPRTSSPASALATTQDNRMKYVQSEL